MKNPSGYCLCGCGQRTPPSPASRRGYKRGEPLRYIKGHSTRVLGPDWVADDNGCWIWQKSIGSQGYGRVWDGERHLTAHIAYWVRLHGPVPEGRELHHTCGVRRCVNPAHLEPVTRWEHMYLDGRLEAGRERGRAMWSRAA